MTALIAAGEAQVSWCGRYRYTLTRRWGSAGPLLFVMLNPSTADATQDDPTIRRCIGFARREGAGGIGVLNLFAFRATDPKSLEVESDPIGPDNEHWVSTCVGLTDGPIVAAWGASVPRQFDEEVRRRIVSLLPVERLRCLGRTQAGHPRHPLYVSSAQQLESYP